MEISRNTHLKIAFFMWGLVGTGLLIAGSFFLFGDRSLSVLDSAKPTPGMTEGLGLAIALVLGFVKGHLVLKKVARKYILRIKSLPETSPFYKTFSVKSWLMIPGMMLIGRIVRTVGAPPLVIGVIYVAVGFALILGSRMYIETPQTHGV
ncbi:MAG: hypothetical protein ACE5GK_08065 [Nitrospiria bacterium]